MRYLGQLRDGRMISKSVPCMSAQSGQGACMVCIRRDPRDESSVL